jgi:hypothetical protein
MDVDVISHGTVSIWINGTVCLEGGWQHHARRGRRGSTFNQACCSNDKSYDSRADGEYHAKFSAK